MIHSIFINFVSDKTKERGWLIFISMLPPILGWILMATVQQNLTNWQNYGILYLTMTATGTVPLMSTYAVQNVQGATKAATVSAVVLMVIVLAWSDLDGLADDLDVQAGNAGGAAGGQIYQPYMAPLFKAGHTVNVGFDRTCFGGFGTDDIYFSGRSAFDHGPQHSYRQVHQPFLPSTRRRGQRCPRVDDSDMGSFLIRFGIWGNQAGIAHR